SVPPYAASTNCVSAGVAIPPHVPDPQSATAWHVVSPGIAILPALQGEAGKTALQPPPSLAANPSPHPSTPAARHPPSDPTSLPGGHARSGGSPAGWQLPSSSFRSLSVQLAPWCDPACPLSSSPPQPNNASVTTTATVVLRTAMDETPPTRCP